MRLFILAAVVGVFLLPAQAQEDNHPSVHVPRSSQEGAFDLGVRAHTNHLMLSQPNGGKGPGGGMAPWQIQSFYGMPASGGTGVIALVDAYDYPTALFDFNAFSNSSPSNFNLPQETSTDPTLDSNKVFQVIYQTPGTPPAYNSGWSQEAALDIEWAHALAPNAKIVLVEANSASFTDLFAAVTLATKIPGVTAISMSWGGSEFSSESSNDGVFSNSSVLFFAASGDSGGRTIYPSASPYVVAVGGTSVTTNAAGGFVSEKGWSGSGGGPSHYELKLSYQAGVAHTSSFYRSVPDVAADADPYTGVSVYWEGSWLVFGGTSVATPCMAAMVNVGIGNGNSYANTTQLLGNIYAHHATFRDITAGKAGHYYCTSNYDYVTGVGSPQGTGGF
jgi:subtilase family serine protease